jgi:hypothetical protein
MDLKRCFKCGVEKPRTEFYRHPAMADGLLGKCKACAKADVTARWNANAEIFRQTDAARRKAKRQANHATGNAIRDGRLVKGVCHYCASTEAVQAHHWNYYRPLDVTWLCKRCHRIADMARRDAELKVIEHKAETEVAP